MRAYGVAAVRRHYGQQEVLLVQNTRGEWGLPKQNYDRRSGSDYENAIDALWSQASARVQKTIQEEPLQMSYLMGSKGKIVDIFVVKVDQAHPRPLHHRNGVTQASWCSFTDALNMVQSSTRAVLETIQQMQW